MSRQLCNEINFSMLSVTQLTGVILLKNPYIHGVNTNLEWLGFVIGLLKQTLSLFMIPLSSCQVQKPVSMGW